MIPRSPQDDRVLFSALALSARRTQVSRLLGIATGLLFCRAFAGEVEEVLLDLGAVLFGVFLALGLLDDGAFARGEGGEGDFASGGAGADLGSFVAGGRVVLRGLGTGLAGLARHPGLTGLTGLSRLARL